MKNFFELNNNEIISKYQNIIEDLMNENFINIDQDIIYPSSRKFFIKYLINQNINENIIYKKISKEFDFIFFNEDEINQEDYIINDIGLLYNDTFYFLNPFFNINKNIYNKNKELLIFKNIGIIKPEDYIKISEKNNFIEECENGAKYFLNNLIYRAVKQNVFNITIDINKDNSESDIFFNFHNNVFKIKEKFKHSKMPEISGIEIFDEISYFIDVKEVNDAENKTIYFISISKYEYTQSILEIEKKYGEKINEMLGVSNGLFILSQKNDYGIYYSILKNIANNTNKQIFSYEKKITTKVEGVFQTVNSHEKGIELFDVVFVKDVSDNSQIELIKSALQLGKLVVTSTISQDSLLALSSFINNFSLDKNLLAEKLIAVYHTTLLPKVCSFCSFSYPIKESKIIKEDKFKPYKMGIKPDTIIKRKNEKGCSNCNHGYEGGVFISELLDNDKDVSRQIESIFNIRELRNLKQSKRWDTIYLHSRFLVERNTITLEDVKNIL
jgi:hypothetical protein